MESTHQGSTNLTDDDVEELSLKTGLSVRTLNDIINGHYRLDELLKNHILSCTRSSLDINDNITDSDDAYISSLKNDKSTVARVPQESMRTPFVRKPLASVKPGDMLKTADNDMVMVDGIRRHNVLYTITVNGKDFITDYGDVIVIVRQSQDTSVVDAIDFYA